MTTETILRAIQKCETVPRVGTVSQYYGMSVESNGPDVFLGELCQVYPPSQSNPVIAEVVGFRDGKVILMPYGNMQGVYIGSEITATGKAATVPVGPEFLGRVVDAFGAPLDQGAPIAPVEHYPLYPEPINHLTRKPISEILETGVGVIDSCLTVGKGQRMGIFAGSGVGKSTLLGMIARNSQSAVNVIALIGERGREVLDFINSNLGTEGLSRSVVVVAGADQPALVRTRAAFAATAIAEYFRNQGMDVMLAMDSVTRFAMAQREIGLAIGEPPTVRGYTPSSFSMLPKLLERAGNFEVGGSITAFYTVLVEGDDFNEPVTDNLRAILDGHIVLSRSLANLGRLPAVALLDSASRLQNMIIDSSHAALISEIRRLLSVHEENKDIIEMGVYQAGRNPDLDKALSVLPKIYKLFGQKPDESVELDDILTQLSTTLNQAEAMNRATNTDRSIDAQKRVRS
jgi:flagellum-specific ATP synthase